MSRQNRFFERPNNLLPHIPFWRAALFAPWRSQKSVRKREDPITDNSFIFRDRQLFRNHQIMSVNKKYLTSAPVERNLVTLFASGHFKPIFQCFRDSFCGCCLDEVEVRSRNTKAEKGLWTSDFRLQTLKEWNVVKDVG